MKAFEVSINGHRLCLAGIGADGVLNVIVNWVAGPERESETFMHVGGLDGITGEHVRWDVPSIDIGSEILIRVVEAATVDPPDRRYRCDPPSTLEQCRVSLKSFCGRLTEDERRQLLRELVADLEGKPT